MPLENSVVLLNIIADQKAKAATPRVTLPSNGGLNNPDFVYRSGSDIAQRQSIAIARQALIRRPKVVAIVDRVLPVTRFGGR